MAYYNWATNPVPLYGKGNGFHTAPKKDSRFHKAQCDTYTQKCFLKRNCISFNKKTRTRNTTQMNTKGFSV